MKNKHIPSVHAVAILGICAVTLFFRPPNLAAEEHQGSRIMIDLGDLGGGTSRAADINDNGQVVGKSSTASGRSHPFLWKGGRMHDLGTLGGAVGGEARALNNRGQVVGNCYLASGETRAFLWENGKMKALPIPEGFTGSFVTGINERGEILGQVTSDPNTYQTCVWRDGNLTDLGQFAAVAINDRGQVAGGYVTDSGEQRGAMWQNGVLTDFGIADYVLPYAINNRGQIVGAALTDTGTFLWQDGVVNTLGSLDGGWGEATAINDRGQVAGQWNFPGQGDEMHLFTWQNGVMKDLGGLAGVTSILMIPTEINERGQIVGLLLTDSFEMRSFVWEDGALSELPTLDGAGYIASAINNSGQIMGNLETQNGYRAVIWIR